MAKSSAWTFQGCGNEAVEHLVRALHRDVRQFVTSLGCRSRVCRRPEPGHLHAGPGQPAPLRRSLHGPHLAAARRPTHGGRQPPERRRELRLSDTDGWQTAAERAQPHDLPGFDDSIALVELLSHLPDASRETFALPVAGAAVVDGLPVKLAFRVPGQESLDAVAEPLGGFGLVRARTQAGGRAECRRSYGVSRAGCWCGWSAGRDRGISSGTPTCPLRPQQRSGVGTPRSHAAGKVQIVP
jgi:RNA polymerase sigma-70 factor, ECF subfamily